MEFADSTTNETPYKILKMIDGNDVLVKILHEYEDSYVVEVPMQVTKQKIVDKSSHTVEHTGLQRWIGFTDDIKFNIEKVKILGLANLSHEVTLYYKMLSNKVKEESGIETNKDEGVMLEELRTNMDRLASLLEGETRVSDYAGDLDFDDDFNEDIYDKDKILH
tara:strand:- start:2086 stop:2577 length:492 start_codon:yes stop_codon:yes gene_type:complete